MEPTQIRLPLRIFFGGGGALLDVAAPMALCASGSLSRGSEAKKSSTSAGSPPAPSSVPWMSIRLQKCSKAGALLSMSLRVKQNRFSIARIILGDEGGNDTLESGLIP